MMVAQFNSFTLLHGLSVYKYKTKHGFLTNTYDFVENNYRFVTRTEAWKIAEAAGQIVRRCGGDDADGGTLYSENLY